MKESLKVQPHHLERGAYLYIRQSSMRQVIENVESAKRQYALRGRAIARKRTPPTALADLTQIMCLGVLKHVGKDTNGQSGGDHLARGAGPEVER